MIKLSGPLASIPGLCLSKPSPQARSRIQQQLPKTNEAWDEWLECIETHQVEAQSLSAMNKLQLTLPQRIQDRLEATNQEIRLYNRFKRHNLKVLLEQLKENQVPVIILNSNAIAKEIFADTDYMSMGHVPLLFQSKDRNKVFSIYQELGFENLYLNEQQLLCSSNPWKKWPQFFNQDLSLRIETHWRVEFAKCKNAEALNNELWQRAKRIDFDGIPALRLSNEDFVQFLCHEINLYDSNLRNISDLYNCLVSWKDMDWQLFFRLATETNSFEQIYKSLALSQSIYYLDDVQHRLDQIKENVNLDTILEVESVIESPEFLLKYRPSSLLLLSDLGLKFEFENRFNKKLNLIFKMLKVCLTISIKEAARLSHKKLPQSLVQVALCYALAYKVLIRFMVKNIIFKDTP